jgi:hypothetical protein
LVVDWLWIRTNRPELLLRSQAHKTILKESVEGGDRPSGKSKVSIESAQESGSQRMVMVFPRGPPSLA